MKDFIMQNFYKLVIILIVVILSIFLLTKGIVIQSINHTHQEQFQYQGQVTMNLFMSNGQVTWMSKKICGTIECYTVEKSKLPPEQSYFATREVVYGILSNDHYIVYPQFSNKK